MSCILSIDQGTTGTTVLIINQQGQVVSRGYHEFKQYYPKPGWVEHDAEEIWRVTNASILDALQNGNIPAQEIAAIGITNQRETTVVWDRKTGKPVYHAIVWQCRRTASLCDKLRDKGYEKLIRKKTGLVLDAYFSATKLQWLLEHVPGIKRRAKLGELAFGTIDSWLLWKLTGGKTHATDYTNASRTMLLNIHTLQWDTTDLLELFGIPAKMLPQVLPSISDFGVTGKIPVLPAGIPIRGIAGDQQAALFGQLGFQPGMAKNTYGTGCFMLFNTGTKAIQSKQGLLTTIAIGSKGEPVYALEGSVFIAGAAVQWLRDGLKLIQQAGDTESLAQMVADTQGMYVVPAFVGLGAPYWKMDARGIITGITRGITKEHLVRATLESIAYQTRDLVEAITTETGMTLKTLKVDGGATQNNFLMQFQADILGIQVERPKNIETTATGAAFLAGLGIGFWKDTKALTTARSIDRIFKSEIKYSTRQQLYDGWKKAIRQACS